METVIPIFENVDDQEVVQEVDNDTGDTVDGDSGECNWLLGDEAPVNNA